MPEFVGGDVVLGQVIAEAQVGVAAVGLGQLGADFFVGGAGVGGFFFGCGVVVFGQGFEGGVVLEFGTGAFFHLQRGQLQEADQLELLGGEGLGLL